MPGYRALDIETVVDHSVWTPPEEKYVLHPMSMIKPHLTAMKEISPAGVTHDKPFPPPHAHRVVAISWVNLNAGNGIEDGKYTYAGHYSECLWSKEDPDTAERTLLKAFLNAQNEDRAMMVTWNGRTFDLPVLSLRALKLGLPFGFYYEDRDIRYRYSEEGHLDLMDWLGDYGAARQMKLGDVAKLIGLPGKTDMSGASIAEMYDRAMKTTDDRQQKTEEEEIRLKVKKYCLADSLQTALIFLRTRVHRGRDVDEHDAALETFHRELDWKERTGLEIEWGKLYLGSKP